MFDKGNSDNIGLLISMFSNSKHINNDNNRE